MAKEKLEFDSIHNISCVCEVVQTEEDMTGLGTKCKCNFTYIRDDKLLTKFIEIPMVDVMLKGD